jgi:hypothetical protein
MERIVVRRRLPHQPQSAGEAKPRCSSAAKATFGFEFAVLSSVGCFEVVANTISELSRI